MQKEVVDGVAYYYGVGKKDQKSFSLISNERLLVLDFDHGKLFYNNRTRALPFSLSIPQPKNVVLEVKNVTTLQEHGTARLEISFPFEQNYDSWKFEFERKEMAEEWVRLIELQKQSHLIPAQDSRVANRPITELAREQENANDIVQEEQRDVIDESRLVSQIVGLSKVSAQNESLPVSRAELPSRVNVESEDWNYRFYRNRHIEVLFGFQNHAADCFFEVFKTDDVNKGGIRQYETKSCVILICNKFSPESKRLKDEYRNYHFILEATGR